MMLEVRNLSVSYGMHRALHEISLYVEEGEIVVILGANGAGKSSLLAAIAGVCEGSATGEIRLDGQGLHGLGADEIVERGVSFVPEARGIFADLTVAENLALGAYASHARQSQGENQRRVLALFPKLQERRSQVVRTMSGGEQQMVAIGRALMAKPKILMLDEPSLGLSPILCGELFQTLARIRSEGLGILLVEQNAKQSLAIADRGYLIENGEITGHAEAESLLNDPAVQSAYLGGAAARLPATGPSASATPEEPADLAPHGFIRPGNGVLPRGSTDRYAGGSIDELVARAEARSRNGNLDGRTWPPRQGAPDDRRSAAGNGGSFESDIARLNLMFETAARKIRNIPAGKASGSSEKN